MKNISIYYNPYRLETKIQIEGEDLRRNSKPNCGKKILQEWISQADYLRYNDTNIIEILTRVKTLATAIAQYHKEGYLYLDIKPENIFINSQSSEYINLVDFGTAYKASDIDDKRVLDLSFPNGFSAPELIQGKISKLGIRTDVYAIGALLYYKLFNMKPTFKDGRYLAKYEFRNMFLYDERLKPIFYEELEEFLHKTIAISIMLRWDSMEQVIKALDRLIKYVDIDEMDDI